jgi:acetyl/propionyl-CoA carboxylase alpha subunit
MGGDAGRARRHFHLEDGVTAVECTSNRDGSLEVVVAAGPDVDEPSKAIHVSGSLYRDGTMDVIIDETFRLKLVCAMQQDQDLIRVRMWPSGLADEYAWALDIRNPLCPTSSDAKLQGTGLGLVKSPMPGKISRVNFAVGDLVEEGVVVVVMEAMKMEHSIKAPCHGRILELGYKPGDVVQDGAVLFLVNDELDDEASEQGLPS